jgi:hypothetical protein
MFNSPNHKTLLRFCILCAIATCLWFFSSQATSKTIQSQDATQFEKHIPVTTNQLEPDNSVIPVELKCEAAELSAPNTLEKLSCLIRNNTNKYITAATMNISITLEKEGKPSIDSSFLTIETFVHPDFREEHKNNLIPPGGERHIEDIQTSYDNAVVKGVTVRIDYVEFADDAARLGPNHAGSRIISNIREGAAKYKDWLIQKYIQSGRSINSITILLEKGQLPLDELGIKNGDQQQGVVFYRNYARKTYETKGAEGLIKYLKQTSTSVNR